MDVDGNNLKQVTSSNFKESMPAFSPDGKYLLIGTNYRSTGTLGYLWDLKIIPNDGKQHDVGLETNSASEVLPVIWKGKDRIESADGQMIWR